MSKTNSKVDSYLARAQTWQEEQAALREIMLGCGLTEELKWGTPCYTFDDSNIVLIHAFKGYCALLFFKGALMKDPKNILIQQTKNVQSARQIRFTGLQQIIAMKTTLRTYVKDAINIEKAGLKVELRKTAEFAVPAEFQTRLKKNAALKTAFAALTPGRQRAYLLYFAAAKQAQTREARIDKCSPRIMDGKGLND